MTNKQETTIEERLDEELYFLSQDGYAVGWREMKKKDILDIFLSELQAHTDRVVKAIEKHDFDFVFHVNDSEEKKDNAVNGAEWARRQIIKLLTKTPQSK